MAKSKLFVKILLIPCTIKNVTLLCHNTGLFYLKVSHSSASVAHKPKLKYNTYAGPRKYSQYSLWLFKKDRHFCHKQTIPNIRRLLLLTFKPISVSFVQEISLKSALEHKTSLQFCIQGFCRRRGQDKVIQRLDLLELSLGIIVMN